MGRIVVSEFVSLDGVIEGPGGGGFRHAGWTFEVQRGEEGDAFKYQELMAADALLLGRRGYEEFAAVWPTLEAGDYGEKMNTMPKYVVSSTIEGGDWGPTTVIGIDEVARVRDELDAELLVFGSAQLVQDLLRRGLVDELRLMVFPVILGSGTRMHGESPDKLPLRLTDSKTVGDGVAILTYQKA